MGILSIFFVLQVLILCVLASFFGILVIFLPLVVINRLCFKKRRIFRLSFLKSRLLIVLLFVATAPQFLWLISLSANKARKAIVVFCDRIEKCDSMGINLNVFSSKKGTWGVTKDPKNVGSVCNILLNSKYKLRSIGIPPFFSDLLEINAHISGEGSLYFNIFPGGIMIDGGPFIFFNVSDKLLFEKILTILKEEIRKENVFYHQRI